MVFANRSFIELINRGSIEEENTEKLQDKTLHNFSLKLFVKSQIPHFVLFAKNNKHIKFVPFFIKTSTLRRIIHYVLNL